MTMTTQMLLRRTKRNRRFIELLLLTLAVNCNAVLAQKPSTEQPSPKEPAGQNVRPKLTLSGAKDGRSAGFSRVTFSADGRRIAAVGQYGTVKIWDTLSGKESASLAADSKSACDVAFSPDGKSLATAGIDGTVKVWDTVTWRQTLVINGHAKKMVMCVAFGPDGKQLASGGMDGSIRIWDAATGKEVRKLTGHGDGVYDVAFSPKGNQLCSTGGDHVLKVWDTTNGKVIMSNLDDEPGFSVAFSPDGRRVASAGGLEGGIRDAATGKQSLVFKDIECVAFSSDGQRVATARCLNGCYDLLNPSKIKGSEIKLLDSVTGKELLALHDPDGVSGLSFSPDGKLLASASYQYKLKIWDIAEALDKRSDK